MSDLGLPNPLLARIPNFKDPSAIRDAITFNPLLNVDISKLSFMEKDAILSGEKVLLSPTKTTLMAAMTWHGMLVKGLQNRNPILSENKKKYFAAIYPNNALEVIEFPSSGMSVNVIKGPTGTGKSITIQRFCNCLPQLVEHGENAAAGWMYHKQLVYLHLNISHDGSRGGFLLSILHEIDRALGTQYSITIPKQNKTIEKLAVATIGRLIAHHTGILFIDESQLRNLVKSSQAEVMQLFLLQLMNSGIPIVISGNERALDWLTYSQDLSRITLTQIFHLNPIGALNESNWEVDWKALCDYGIMKFYVLNKPIQDFEACSKLLFESSGGIARLAVTLWTQAQRNCLFKQKESISSEDIENVYESLSYKYIKKLADGFRYKNAHLLSTYPDVDADFYKLHWQNNKDEEFLSKPLSMSKAKDRSDLKPHKTGMSEQAKFNSERTRKSNKFIKSESLKTTLSGEDLRNSGTLNHHLAQLADLRHKLEDENE